MSLRDRLGDEGERLIEGLTAALKDTLRMLEEDDRLNFGDRLDEAHDALKAGEIVIGVRPRESSGHSSALGLAVSYVAAAVPKAVPERRCVRQVPRKHPMGSRLYLRALRRP